MKIKPIVLTAQDGGRCLPACIAMITGLRFDRIPDFREQGDAWLPNMRAWLNQHGWGCVYIHRRAIQMSTACLGTMAAAPIILCGKSRRGEDHAVVQSGETILDPDAGKSGVEEWDFAFVLVQG